jgi:hypothetical protein
MKKTENKNIIIEDRSLTRSEKRKLVELGKKLIQVEQDRDDILTKAREIIGFETAECCTSIDEEFDGLWNDVEDQKMIFVEYAKRERARWDLEDAMERIKIIMKSQGFEPDDLNWTT